jgi:hypothetical protein
LPTPASIADEIEWVRFGPAVRRRTDENCFERDPEIGRELNLLITYKEE